MEDKIPDPFTEGRWAAKNGYSRDANPYEGIKRNRQQAEACEEWYDGYESHKGV